MRPSGYELFEQARGTIESAVCGVAFLRRLLAGLRRRLETEDLLWERSRDAVHGPGAELDLARVFADAA